MLDLPEGLIGTNPKYPSIVNHDWLTVDPKTYDNYPSDNNPVRVAPKLAEIWNHQESKGISIVPNLTVQQLGVQGSEVKASEVSASVVREVKKAMMAGIKGKDLANHLRARFSPMDVIVAKDALAALSEEQGLLGNVYIDASAFTSSKEAETFMTQHRTRLAQDIVVNESKLNPNVISVLANKFRKNVLAKVNYDVPLFEKYKNHLVASGRIPKDFVIDSKETLRQAFLYVSRKETVVKASTSAQKIDKSAALKVLTDHKSKEAKESRLASDDILFRRAFPILKYAREQMTKGKLGNDLKEMLRKKYAGVDLNESAKLLAIVISAEQMALENINKMVETGSVSEYVGSCLKKLAKDYPVKKTSFEEEAQQAPQSIGVQGYFYSLSGSKASDDLDGYRQASVIALRKGISLEKIGAKLGKVLPKEQASQVLTDALSLFNSVSAGVKANPAEKKAKEKVVADIPEPQTLPDPSTILPQTQEILSFYEGAGNDIDIDLAPSQQGSVQVGDLFNRSGIDSAL